MHLRIASNPSHCPSRTHSITSYHSLSPRQAKEPLCTSDSSYRTNSSLSGVIQRKGSVLHAAIMDEVVGFVDHHLMSTIFQPLSQFLPDFLGSISSESSVFRQVLSIYFIIGAGGTLLYFFLSSLSYLIFFVIWREKYHPKSEPQSFKGQEWQEIRMSLRSIPTMAHLTVPFLLGEVRGYSKLYASVDEYGWMYLFGSLVLFILWSDTLIYWIHRGLHEIPWMYKYIHKDHHKWKVPTPYAAIAFHPLDGWLQSTPYHLFPYLLPMNKWLSLTAFIGVQVWTVLIHDGVHWTPFEFVNGAAHHTFHHSKFYYNYGQFFTYWDRWAGTHMSPFAVYDPETKQYVPTRYGEKG